MHKALIRIFAAALAGAAVACGGGGNDAATPEACARSGVVGAGAPRSLCLPEPLLALVHDEYRRRHAAGTLMQPIGGYDPRFYPAEVLVSVAALAQTRGDNALLAWVDEELAALYLRLQAQQGYLLWPVPLDGQPAFGSNSQSRLVLGLILLNRQRPTDTSLAAARLAWAALERMPLLAVRSSVTGQLHNLPAYAYKEPPAPRAVSSRTLDPNHDAALALAYALASRDLATDDAQAQSARARGHQFLDAALDLAKRPGCLALADDPSFLDACDTRYNGFWLALTEAAASVLGRNDEARPTLAAQYALIRPWWQRGQTSRVYPARYAGPYPDPVEPWLLVRAVPTFDDDSAWATYLQVLQWVLSNSSSQGWPAGWLFPLAFMRL